MKHYYVCVDENASDYWEGFKGKLNDGDTIVISGYDTFVTGLVDMKDKLEYCIENNIKLIDDIWDEMEVNPKRDLAFANFTLSLRNENYKKNQLKGIEEALELKKSGKGAYGRPTAKLPEDFEQKIIEYKENHKPLETYRKITKLTKSTFYKYAKAVIQEHEEKKEKEKRERLLKKVGKINE